MRNRVGETSSEESNKSNEDAYPCDKDLLMIRRILDNQPSQQESTQR